MQVGPQGHLVCAKGRCEVTPIRKTTERRIARARGAGDKMYTERVSDTLSLPWRKLMHYVWRKQTLLQPAACEIGVKIGNMFYRQRCTFSAGLNPTEHFETKSKSTAVLDLLSRLIKDRG